MRCRIACASVSAPSAVCTTDTPSCALRTATLRPPTWARRPSEIARPAASSAARLIRKPLDSFSSDLDICPSVMDRFRYAFCAAMFWLIRRPMIFLLVRVLLAHPWAAVAGPIDRWTTSVSYFDQEFSVFSGRLGGDGRSFHGRTPHAHRIGQREP